MGVLIMLSVKVFLYVNTATIHPPFEQEIDYTLERDVNVYPHRLMSVIFHWKKPDVPGDQWDF